MKKIVGLLLIVGLYAAAAFYTGYQGEKNIRHQFALSEQEVEAQGVKLVLNSYERGVFFSKMDFTASYADAAVPFGPISLTSRSKIQHGPLLFLGKFGAGLFSSVSTIEIHTQDEEINQSITELFGESIGELVTLGHFNSSYTAIWTIPDVVYESEGNKLTVATSTINVSGTYENLDATGSYAIGAIELLMENGSRFNSTVVSGNFATVNVAEAVNITNMDMAVETLSFLDASMVGFSIEQLKMIQQQKLINEKIDTSVSFIAEKVKSPVEVTSLRYDVALNQLNPVAVQKWAGIAKKMQASPTQQPNPFVEQGNEMTELMDLLLQEGLSFTLHIGAEFMGGTALVDLSSNYKPLPAGQEFKDIVNPRDYFLLADTDLLIKVSESIVTQTPLVMMVGQYMGTYVTQEGDQYVMHATLKDGKLMIGSSELPLDMLLALLPQNVDEEINADTDPEPAAIDEPAVQGELVE